MSVLSANPEQTISVRSGSASTYSAIFKPNRRTGIDLGMNTCAGDGPGITMSAETMPAAVLVEYPKVRGGDSVFQPRPGALSPRSDRSRCYPVERN
jgi:hypothetical protein